MYHKIALRLFVFVVLIASHILGLLEFVTIDAVYTQSEIPFLITPYYANASINSWFDHWYPGTQYDNDYNGMNR